MQTLTVELGERSYPIYIGAGLLSDRKLLNRHLASEQTMVVTNTSVASLYLDQLSNEIASQLWSELRLPDGEAFKDLTHLSLIYDQLLEDRHNRSTTLIALGGGVVGDMTGFAAASYQRGVNFIQIPTTLLSQVDSSVGGKTGVNHLLGKNMIGAFYQPQCVIIDIDTLKTLPGRELKAGLAEVIKYGIIYDENFFEWLEHNHDALMQLDEEAIIYAIHRSCQIKAEVVAQDEREGGLRAILNLGHTFGHAIETEQGYGNWLHGEAVGAGMVMAADLSLRMGKISLGDAQRIKALVENAGLPVAPPVEMTPEQFLSRMSVDKKVTDGQLKLILVESIGEACITADIDRDMLNETLVAGPLLCSV